MIHQIPGIFYICVVLAAQAQLGRWLNAASQLPPSVRRRLRILNWTIAVWIVAGFFAGLYSVSRVLPVFWVTWVEALSMMTGLAVLGVFVVVLLLRSTPRFREDRRKLLRTAVTAVVAAPYVAGTVGIIKRNDIHLHEQDVPVRNLPRDLHGLRIVQVTDVHLSPFLSEKELARAIDIANEAKGNIVVMTGDLISRLGDPLDACLRQLQRLRADAGVIGCLGNHERFTQTEEYVATAGRRMGIDFLRYESRLLKFGNAEINFAGVDYQNFHEPYLIGTEELVKNGALNVMLSHNPDVFPVAARQGYDLTISGHTHGGQVNFEIVDQNVNVARYFTHYVKGLYQRDNSSIYVSTGIGTVGAPVRVGAAPEIALIRLCAI